MTRSRCTTCLIFAMLAAAVALAAVALAGCSSGSGHVTRAECAAQFNAWKTGSARAAATSMTGYLTSLDFKGAVPDAQKLETMPMPSCADPAGYWPQLLKRIVAIGNNSGYGLGYLMEQAQAIAPLENKLGAELKRTAGVNP